MTNASPQLSQRRKSANTVGIVALLAAAALFAAARIQPDSDPLAIMPADHPDVQAFREVQTRFGGMDIVQVGIAAPDVFAPAFLGQLQKASEALAAVDGVKNVLSLTTVQDFVADTENGGIVTGKLIASPPETDDDARLLRARVMQKGAIVGNLVSPNGQAVQIYCFLQHRADSAQVAKALAGVVEPFFAGSEVAYGGAPYIAAAAADAARSDLARVGPWAALGLVLGLLIVLRDAVRGIAVLASSGLGVLAWAACMGLSGTTMGPSLAMVPLVAFVVGSALQLQVAVTWQRHMSLRALRTAARSSWGAGVLFTALLLSLAMLPDVRAFCDLTALAMVLQGAAAFLVLPAMLTLLPERVAPASPVWIAHVSPPRAVLGLFAALLLLAASQVRHVDGRIDLATLLGEQSAPVRSTQLFREHFGTAQFLFLQVDGDFNDPLILRELEWLADSVTLMPGVTAVAHLGSALTEVNAAMEGVLRMPDTRDKAALLYGFVSDQPAIKQLVNHDADHALLTIKVGVTGAQLDALIEDIAARVQALSGPRVTATSPGNALALQRLRDRVATRIIAAARFSSVALPENADTVVRDALAALPSHPDDHQGVAQGIATFLASDECPVLLPDALRDDQTLRSAGYAVASLDQGASESAVADALEDVFGGALSNADLEDLALVLQAPLDDLWQQAVAQMRAHALLQATRLPEVPAVWHDAVVSAVMDLRAATVLVPSAGATGESQATFSLHLTGEPLLHRALAADVHKMLTRCAALAALVLLAGLVLWYRSAMPVALLMGHVVAALVFMAGTMGWLNIHVDPTTLPLAITVVGLALAYGMHGLAGESGNMAHACLLASAFSWLTMAYTPALENMGALVTVGALASAASAWIILPALVAPLRETWAERTQSL